MSDKRLLVGRTLRVQNLALSTLSGQRKQTVALKYIIQSRYVTEAFYGSREVQFPARRPFPHAEGQLRMRTYFLRVRRASSACGDPAPHAGVSSPRAETLLRMRRYLLGVRRLCSACGGSVLTCGDLFFKPSQPSRFITPPVLIVASILAWLTFLRSLFSRDCDFYKTVTARRAGP